MGLKQPANLNRPVVIVGAVGVYIQGNIVAPTLPGQRDQRFGPVRQRVGVVPRPPPNFQLDRSGPGFGQPLSDPGDLRFGRGVPAHA